jgi:hypothetical protein
LVWLAKGREFVARTAAEDDGKWEQAGRQAARVVDWWRGGVPIGSW